MRYRILGRTGLEVSILGFGSTELGMDYGIKVPGEYGKPDTAEAGRIIHKALDLGINFFDTAPVYGNSENLLGDYIGSRKCSIATKVGIAAGEENISGSVRNSVEASLRNLKRDCLDILQIHSPSIEIIRNRETADIISSLRKEGMIRFSGVSVYEPQEAMEVIAQGCYDVIQAAFNILDQRISEQVMPLARENNIGIITRSAYFRGMLTEKVEYLDDNWKYFKDAASKIKKEMQVADWPGLSRMALRFCLSASGPGTVLAGIRTMRELDAALAAEEEGPLDESAYAKLLGLKGDDEYWLNTLNWYKKI